jgi:hypothetical protein
MSALGNRGLGMDRIRDILLYVAAAFAMLSFACAVYQAMNEKLQSAARARFHTA